MRFKVGDIVKTKPGFQPGSYTNYTKNEITDLGGSNYIPNYVFEIVKIKIGSVTDKNLYFINKTDWVYEETLELVNTTIEVW